MVLALVIGDFHVPDRAPELCKSFKSMLVAGKIQHILCTGNLISREIEDYLRTVGADVTIVGGDMDTKVHHPAKAIVNIENLSIGICHGHQIVPWGDELALEAMKREMSVDVLITGHTHDLKIRQGSSGGLFINPGSATGAPTLFEKAEHDPSFVLMDVQGSLVVTYSYRLQGEELKVDTVSHGKIK